MKKITLKELQERGCATQSRRDNSPRGIETVPTSAVKIGDEIIINNEFVTVVSELESAREICAENAEQVRRAKDHAEKVLAAWRSMTDAERVQHVRTTPRESRIMREYDEAQKELKFYEDIGKIHAANLRAAVAEEVAAALVIALSKFDGKPAGPATRKKICEEVAERVPCASIYFEDRGISTAESDGVHISLREDYFACWTSFYLYTKWDEAANDRPDLIGKDNRINGKISIKNFDFRPFKTVALPAVHLDKLREAREKIEELKAAYNAACDEYNALNVGGFEQPEKIYNGWRK